MLISREWLSEYCDLTGLSDDAIAEALTGVGLEVEGLQKIPALDRRVVVGTIAEAKRHPQADKLQLCQVEVGASTPLTIVCGAANARPGLKVAVATVGCELPGAFVIKAAKVRGEASDGMLCSAKELGLAESDAGIVELPQSYEVGIPLAQYVDSADTVFTLNVTPNRGDCLSYVGVARDLAAKLGRHFTPPPAPALPESNFTTAQRVKLKVESELGCGRFVALACEQIPAIAAPLWMQRRLQAAGMRPISLMVDLSNYCMLELGQPSHAYDAEQLAGRQLEVRAATLADQLVTLDGQKAALQPGDILICDAEKPVGLAGVMGGANAEVSANTRSVIIEIAHFAASQVRKTAKRLAFHTEASRRFERGIDIEQLPRVACRLAHLLVQAAEQQGAAAVSVAKTVVDFDPLTRAPARIALRLPRLRSLLGLPLISLDTCVRRLEALEFKLVDRTDERMLFAVPSFRNDIQREIDLIEEVVRMEGYEKVPYEMPKMMINPNYEDPFLGFGERLKVAFAQAGLCEVITFPFMSYSDFALLQITAAHPLWPSLELANALNDDMAAMQTSLVPSLIKALVHNRNRGQKGSRIFEMGRAYRQGGGNTASGFFASGHDASRHLAPKARTEKGRPVEIALLAGALDEPFVAQEWNQTAQPPDFFTGKQLVQSVAAAFGVQQLSWERPSPELFPWLHPGASAVIKVGQREVGWLGELHPKTLLDAGLGADGSVVVFELKVADLFEAAATPVPVNRLARRFPPVLRDLAFVVDRELSYDDFAAAVKSFPNRRSLKGMHLFDVYTGAGIDSTKKSLAAAFTFEADDRTLTDSEVEKELTQLREWMAQQVQAELRA